MFLVTINYSPKTGELRNVSWAELCAAFGVQPLANARKLKGQMLRCCISAKHNKSDLKVMGTKSGSSRIVNVDQFSPFFLVLVLGITVTLMRVIAQLIMG